MAENKKSIIVYAEWIEQFEYLTDEEAGKLIKHFFRYVNDLNPVAPDRFTEAQFIPIKQTLKRDLEKWEKTIQERSLNGRLGNIKKHNIDLYNKIQNNIITLEEAEEIAKNRKASQPDSKATKNIANVADNVNVNVNDIITKVINIEDAEILILSDTDYLKDFERVYGVEVSKIPIALTEFKNHSKTIGEDKGKTLKDFKKHFSNWVRKKKILKQQEKTNQNKDRL